MTYLKIQRFVKRARKRASKNGCNECGRVVKLGLKEEPSLSEMSRDGTLLCVIKFEIRQRGWYCRKCVDRMERSTTTAATLRDQFPTEEAYHAFLMKRRYPDGVPLS